MMEPNGPNLTDDPQIAAALGALLREIEHLGRTPGAWPVPLEGHSVTLDMIYLQRMTAVLRALELAAALLPSDDAAIAQALDPLRQRAHAQIAVCKRTGHGWFVDRTSKQTCVVVDSEPDGVTILRAEDRYSGPRRIFRWRDEHGQLQSAPFDTLVSAERREQDLEKSVPPFRLADHLRVDWSWDEGSQLPELPKDWEM